MHLAKYFMEMNRVHLLLGSNQQNPQQQLIVAQQYVNQKIGTVLQVSSVYRTEAWGFTDQPDFYNQVIIVETTSDAQATMHRILQIEQEMGRIRTIKNAPRVIDIDILFFNTDIVQSADLVIPHPQIQNRNFVLVPLYELDPAFIHPALQQTIADLLIHSPDQLAVHKI
ncbi:MAG: 2-amino-4-hydroxy-6-hydroxymethyldihydropteridine diphosphokinase [Bacteroidetes bacterium]|nr:2-amino-4-hydroxy-6-hydroxymethyldihydropteridine diphosphokinase [Bacteroidota bacterium]